VDGECSLNGLIYSSNKLSSSQGKSSDKPLAQNVTKALTIGWEFYRSTSLPRQYPCFAQSRSVIDLYYFGQHFLTLNVNIGLSKYFL